MPQWVLDVQKLRLLPEPAEPVIDEELECDILVAGAGLGGCAAALTACRAGRRVVLTEETEWPGGQITSQGVSALDEHPHIETFGATRAYAELRRRIREGYRNDPLLRADAREAPELNPGGGWVSRLCFEPRVGLAVLREMLAPHAAAGRLIQRTRLRAVSAEVADDAVRSVTFRHLDGDERVRVRAAFVLDATELGDLLALSGAAYACGAESAAETGEPGAPETPDPRRVQSFTYPFVLELRPGERHRVPRPREYARDRRRQPFTLRHRYHDERGVVTYRMFAAAPGTPGSFWSYRRIRDGALYRDDAGARDLALINWPGNDFRHAGILDAAPGAALAALKRAKALSLGFCRWLQTECPRDDGGAGYPELRLATEVLGTGDGLSMFPYIREARRARTRRIVTERDIAAVGRSGARAEHFPDSVGVGLYPIDIHPAEGEEKLPPDRALPFQVPLGALVPVRMRNLLPAAKNIGASRIANGAYRLHPVEWNAGEAAAQLALFCLDRGLGPQAVAESPVETRALQRRVVRAGIPIHWFTDVPAADPLHEAAQLLGGWGIWTGDPDSLAFAPDRPADEAAIRASAPGWARALLPEPAPRPRTRRALALAFLARLRG